MDKYKWQPEVKERTKQKGKYHLKMINRIKNTLFYAGLEKTEYESLKKKRIQMNQESLMILTTLTAFIMIIMLVLSFQSKEWIADRSYYVMCLCISVGIMAVIYSRVIQSEWATLIIVYLYLSTIFLYAIAIGSTQPAITSVSFLIFIMAGPLLFYDRPARINIFIWAFNILFLFNSIEVKEASARDTDIINGIIYGGISSILNTSAVVFKIKRAWLEKKLSVMAETDTLTKLKNRNCFNHHYQEYKIRARKNVTCIYMDVNGLHYLNNAKGHEAGDEMLRYIAEQILLVFGEEDAYRIGGDEYMVVCCDKDIETINQQTKELEERLKEKNYSVSIGTVNASAKELNMDELIKKADAQMYLAKKKHYEQKGIDRRKNRRS